ncbi:hypothetical protein C8R46DRAFT_499882 [Mycena filopes]|nr:hypothetical protein C8R46DRAFT_499882 [Mycena filopes]
MPLLPIELQREIVEIAVRANPKNRALQLDLSLVAHHVHFWVEQILHESVTIDNGQSLLDFLDLVASKPADFFATAVKLLNVSYTTEASQAASFLALCPQVQVLVFHPRTHLATTVPPPHLDRLPLRRLCIPREVFATIMRSPNSEPTWLSTLTHLDIGFIVSGLSSAVTVQLVDSLRLSRLPRLTHVALWISAANPVLAGAICTSCPSLRVLAMCQDGAAPRIDYYPDFTEDQAAYVFDLRIVVVGLTDLEDSGRWDAARLGRPDFWTRAEGVVDRRRARASAAAQSGR